MTQEIPIRSVRREEWERVRELRLRALADAPDAFGSTLEEERGNGEPEWIGWIEGWEGARNILFVAEEGERWFGMAVGSRAGKEPDAHLYGGGRSPRGGQAVSERGWSSRCWPGRGPGTRAR